MLSSRALLGSAEGRIAAQDEELMRMAQKIFLILSRAKRESKDARRPIRELCHGL